MKCYTDASFDPKSNVAVIGYSINSQINFETITNTTNTKSEICAIISLIKYLIKENVKECIIFTDCQSIINRINKKDILCNNNFMTKKGKILNNANSYKELFDLLDNINANICHIKGHKPTIDKNDDDIIFSKLDKFLRHELRKNKNIVI
jgi:ribonuclease HI